MTHIRLVAVALAGLVCSGSQQLMAQDALRLEYKLASGTELVYKTEGTFGLSRADRKTAMNATLSAETRIVVCDTDADKRLTTIGRLRSANVAVVTSTPQGEQRKNEVKADVDVLRIDVTGRPVLSEWKLGDEGTDKERLRVLRFVMSRFEQNALDAVTLASGNVAIGAQWESQFEFPTRADMPVPTKARSTFVALRDVDGRKCALVKSTLLPSDNPWAGMAFTGDVETLFDIERGLTREVNMELRLRSKTDDAGTFEFKTKLASERMMPKEEAARFAALVRDLGAALTKLYENDAEGAVEALQAVPMKDMPENWRKGRDGTLQNAVRVQSIVRAKPDAKPR